MHVRMQHTGFSASLIKISSAAAPSETFRLEVSAIAEAGHVQTYCISMRILFCTGDERSSLETPNTSTNIGSVINVGNSSDGTTETLHAQTRDRVRRRASSPAAVCTMAQVQEVSTGKMEGVPTACLGCLAPCETKTGAENDGE